MKISSIAQFVSFFPIQPVVLFFVAYLLIFLSSTFLTSNRAYADVWEKLQSHEFQENENAEDFIWKEGNNDIPDYPEDRDLMAVAGPPAYQNYQYLIDGKNLLVGADGVVRYSMVIRSSSGSDNAIYQGLRCTTHQVKSYAYGSVDVDGKKTFIPRQEVKWKPVHSTGVSGYSQSLAVNYFCDHNGTILKRHEIIQNIKYGKGNIDGLYD